MADEVAKPQIDILLATYNGEKYLAEQIDSILEQTYINWRLVIRDDCSKDGTRDIIGEYIAKYPDKIVFIDSDIPSGSAQNNFFALMKHASAEYIMFCDQDDVWLPEKVQVTLDKMLEMEKKHEKETSILVFTDLCVVDENLNILGESLAKYGKLDPERNELCQILSGNVATGCTQMFNRKLLQMVHVTPKYAFMHDAWVLLIASSFGKAEYLDKATIFYRQHENNTCGTRNVYKFGYLAERIKNRKNIKENILKRYAQAKEFLQLYEDRFNKRQKEIVKAFISLEKANPFKRAYLLWKYRLYRNTLWRVLAQIVL